MTSATPPDLPELLLDALCPIQRRIHGERTLSVGKIGILRHLTEVGRATAGDLAKHVRVSPQAVSLATRELESLGLVVRERDEVDRRRTWFALTDAGRARYEVESTAGHAWLAEAIERRLTAAEARTLTAAVPVLAKLVADD